MKLIKPIIWTLTNDPYWIGPGAQQTRFVWERPYTVRTQFGFAVNLTVACLVNKVDHEQFRAGRMREEANQQALVRAWYEDVCLPKLKELGCSFEIIIGKNLIVAELCRPGIGKNEGFVCIDPLCLETMGEMKKTEYVKNGCSVEPWALRINLDDENLEENYNMIKARALNSFEDSEEYREQEESMAVTLLHRHMELRREFQRIQTDQKHESKIISVETRLVGRTVELSWKLSGGEHEGSTLRGYRKADTDHLDFAGMIILETQKDSGKTVQNLVEDKEYFYTFLLTKDEPTYAQQSFPQNLLNSPAVIGSETKLLDSLRFSIRVPGQSELLYVQQTIEKLKERDPDPRREPINRALEELRSFVEFDEAISNFEKVMMKEIESKGYSDGEKKDKIERLQGAVESIRVRH
jgi:hypothetical protein